MTSSHPLTRWQRAASLAVEGVCILPYLLSAMLSIIPLSHADTGIDLTVLISLTALLYGITRAPLHLWRVAWYARLCHTNEQLPSLRLPRHLWRSFAWRWHLWWRRVIALSIGCLPSSILFGIGSTDAIQADGTAPLLWLLLGGLTLLVGVVGACVWLCRYALAPYYILNGESADTAMALSVRTMRGRRCSYINDTGSDWTRLLPCLLIVPTLWALPTYRYRRADRLLALVERTQ